MRVTCDRLYVSCHRLREYVVSASAEASLWCRSRLGRAGGRTYAVLGALHTGLPAMIARLFHRSSEPVVNDIGPVVVAEPEEVEPVLVQGPADQIHSRELLVSGFGADGSVGATENLLGQEQARPVATRTLAVHSLLLRQRAIERALEREESEVLRWQLRECKESLDWERGRLYEYVASNDLRNALKEGESLDRLHQTEPVNMYLHTVSDQERPVASVVRAGVLFYERFGMTSLLELKKARKEKEGSGEFREVVLERLERFSTKKATPEVQVAVEETKELFATPEVLDEAIACRMFNLEQKMIVVLQGYLESSAEALREDVPFYFMQLSLLNPSKKKIERSGFAHIEARNMEDMYEVYKLFEGRRIIFESDLQAPYIDGRGQVYMPKPAGCTASSVVVQPLFVNVSVQGHKAKDLVVQQTLNERAFGVLRLMLEQRGERELFEQCCRRMERRESSYELAEDMAVVAHSLGVAVGMNCFSAKDRTMYVAFRFLRRSLVSVLVNKGDVEEKRGRKLFGGLAGFNRKTVGFQIIQANGMDAVKVSKVFVPGVGVGELGARMGVLMHAAISQVPT